MSEDNEKPSIEELEAILERPDDDFIIHINPDGSIQAVEREEKLTIHDLGKVLEQEEFRGVRKDGTY